MSRTSGLAGALRRLDVELRRTYFRQQTFRRRGAYLLLGGVSATLLLAHWSTTMRRRLPDAASPELASLDPKRARTVSGNVASVALVADRGGRSFCCRNDRLRAFASQRSTEVADGRSASSRPDADVTVSTPSPTPRRVAASNRRSRWISELPTPEQIAAIGLASAVRPVVVTRHSAMCRDLGRRQAATASCGRPRLSYLASARPSSGTAACS